MKPTIEQESIINHVGHTVVIAQPGSGKTFTLVTKIIQILKELKEYQGVIAISYTRKASRELEKRCLQGGIEKKGTFFGTMDKFYLVEIVIPFGRHIFGRPKREIEVIEMYHEVIKGYISSKDAENINDDTFTSWAKKNVQILKQLYLDGYIILDAVPIMALYLLENSHSCINYLKSRYKYIIIDEYQDSGAEQHDVFLKLKNIGLTAIAVGDINQSIFGFANKSSEFLLSIAQDSTFKVFPLSKNYRCHPSIINYSMKLISRDFVDFIPTNENRIFGITITGKETDIASWLNNNIIPTMQKYGVTDYNEVAILVRGRRTGKIIDENLQLKHKFFDITPFDSDSSLWGTVFVDVIRFIFDTKNTKYALIDTYFDLEIQKSKARAVMSLLSKLEAIDKASVFQHKETIIQIAEIIFPNAFNQNSINILDTVLNDNKHLESFKSANEDEVQIMTLHKSKGLEFSIVFHLDLYEYIFPLKIMNEKGEFVFSDPKQDVNLHYVGITRAKECCVLCSSTKRTNANGYIKSGNKSEFLRLPRLESLRQVF